MRRTTSRRLLVEFSALALGLAGGRAPADPPFSGTIFIDPNIITSADRSTFQSAVYTGQGLRTMFDRRVDDFVEYDAFLFNATFDDGLSVEIQVNPEFGDSDAAQTEAEKYGEVIGRLPTALRVDVQTVWIHEGTEPFGGGNNNLLIHTGQAALYEADGILEETFVHEASHTSLDATHAEAAGWLDAQAADGEFISTYARDNPLREDIAESFLPYLAVRYRADRIPQSLTETINATIPHRLAYFAAQEFDMYPIPRVADFNQDGSVDGGDLGQWQRDYGAGAGSDADRDGDSDGADVLIWQQQVDGAAAFAAVPEPAAILVAGAAFCAWTSKRRRGGP